jgi:DHA1 family tetracycline resistance protein-like MFS transporter
MTSRAGFAVLLATIFIDMLGIGLMWPVLPTLVRELNGGGVASASETYGRLVALYSLMQFCFGPALGALSDRFGRRPVIVLSLLGLTVDYIILAVAHSIWWVFAARLVGGVFGATIAIAFAYVADISPPERRAKDFGLLGMALALGVVAGPVIGGALGEVGTRAPFVFAAILSGIAVASALFLLPESLATGKRRRFHLAEANPFGAFVFFRRYPVVIALISVLALAKLGEWLLETNWVIFAGYRFGWGSWEAGLSLGFFGLVYGAVQGGLVRLVVPRFGELRTLEIGLVIGAACLFLFAFADRGWMLYAILVPYAIGWGSAGPAVQALITKAVGTDEQGLLQGVIAGVNSATGALAPQIGGSLFAWFVGPKAPFQFPGIAFALGGVLFAIAFALTRGRRFRAATAAAGRGASPA